MSGRPISNSVDTTPRNSISFHAPFEQEFIDMPEAAVANLSISDSYPSQPRPEAPTLRVSSPLPTSESNPNIPRSSPPISPLEEDDWLTTLENERDNAVRTTNAEVALSWAEKVYMYVSISLDDYRRQHDDPRPSTPLRERQLRSDCVGIVEKFVKARHPKAIYMRGIWYEYGDFNYALDRHEAYKAYEMAAKLGYARAEYRIGKMYLPLNA